MYLVETYMSAKLGLTELQDFKHHRTSQETGICLSSKSCHHMANAAVLCSSTASKGHSKLRKTECLRKVACSRTVMYACDASPSAKASQGLQYADNVY